RVIYDPREAHTVSARKLITRQLGLWHDAAATGNGHSYFSRMSPDAVFLGTDRTERWPLPEFEAFARPYFADDEAWTYRQVETHIAFHPELGPADEPTVGWFDEVLWNDKYGYCRGTGVAVYEDRAWKIAHYSLTFLVPNEAAEDVVEIIRGSE
ncbi:MAG: nuclear transport factor 2 family protein, partial [Phycisphaerales bacterium]|nr:nuclear transport factor 2 family protein [Phycisphaerales bacterium]